MNTVEKNKARYTVSDYERAVKARTIQRRIGRPRTKRYLELISKGRIPHCDVTGQDFMNAEDIFGPDIGSLKRKNISDQVQSGGMIPIPATIMQQYRKVVLGVDIMKVNGIPYVITMSGALKFGTTEWIPSGSAKVILAALKRVNISSAVSCWRSWRSTTNLNLFVGTSHPWVLLSTHVPVKNMSQW